MTPIQNSTTILPHSDTVVNKGFIDFFTEWTKGSAVSDEITLANLELLNNAQLNDIVKPKNRITSRSGWQCKGVNWRTGLPMGTRYGQVKPSEPHIIDPTNPGKTAKYLTPSGMEPDAITLALSRHEVDKKYWVDVHADLSIPIVFTEGVKKAGSGLTIGVPTIAFSGVWNWGKDGKLAPITDEWVQAGRVILIAFDSDYVDKPSCRKAILKLAELIAAKGAIPLIVVWDDRYKGMDDFIKAEGADAFRKAKENALTVEQWEKQFSSSNDTVSKGKTKKNPPADELGKKIAEDYRSKLAFNDEATEWRHYEIDNPGVWSVESNNSIQHIVYQLIKSQGISGYNTNSYVENVVKALQNELFSRKWGEITPKELMPFKNGVLELSTGKFLEHSPGYRFTWTMPREYGLTLGKWNKINAFLDHATAGNKQLKQILLCFANATLKGRSDLQKALLCTGQGGSGKSTYIDLLQMLIGDQNTHSSSLHDLCGNQFEIANAYRKRLIVFPDEGKFSGNLSQFKKLTGGDFLRGEEKGKKAFNFKFDGMVVIASNFPIFVSENSSGIRRRIITVPFNNVVADSEKRDLTKDFESEISAFTQHLLTIPDEVVTEVLRNAEVNSPLVAQMTLDYDTRTDSTLEWMIESLIIDDVAQLQVGSNKDEIKEAKNGICVTAFGHYHNFCADRGSMAKSHKEFSPKVEENARKWIPNLTKKRTTQGTYFTGVRLRIKGQDDHIPFLDSQAGIVPIAYVGSTYIHPTLDYESNLHSQNEANENTNSSNHAGSNVGWNVGSDVGSQPLLDKGYVGYVGSSSNSNEDLKNAENEPETVPKIELLEEVTPSTCTTYIDVTVEAVEPIVIAPKDEPVKPSIKVGDSVKVIKTNQVGTVVKVSVLPSQRHGDTFDYKVDLGSETEIFYSYEIELID